MGPRRKPEAPRRRSPIPTPSPPRRGPSLGNRAATPFPPSRPPCSLSVRHFLPSTWPAETSGFEGDPKASEEHRPIAKEEALRPPGKRSMCYIHSWCGLQLASPGPVGPTRGGRSISCSSL
ncbi:histone H3-like centromeric protein A isoform 3-T3 [Trichechus inunguis]